MEEDKKTKVDYRIEIIRGFEELWNAKWKFFILLPFIVCAIYLLVKYIHMDHNVLKDICNTFYPIIKAIIDIFIKDSTFDAESFFNIARNIMSGLILSIELLFILSIVVLIGKTPNSNTFKKKITKIKFYNDLTCRYKWEKKNKEIKHGKIICLEGEGLIKDDFWDAIERIESTLRKFTICKIKQDSLDKAIFYLYCIPNKYAKPIEISINNDIFSDILINLLLTGSTGSGKSTTLVVLVGMLINSPKYRNGMQVSIVTYKPSAVFSQFRGTKNYYEFLKAFEGFEKCYNELHERMKDSPEKWQDKPHIVIFDEFPSFVLAQDKKVQDEILRHTSEILNMGREYSIFPIISANRRGRSLLS